MQTQKDGPFLGRRLLLLLLGLVMPLASTQDLSYRDAVLRAVDGYNQESSDTNLYRLLHLNPQPSEEDENFDASKPVSFTVKETVCPKGTQQPLEQCDFKELGRVKQCTGRVTQDQDADSFDINCKELHRFKRAAHLFGLLRKGGEKIGGKLQKIGQKIKDFFQNLGTKPQ